MVNTVENFLIMLNNLKQMHLKLLKRNYKKKETNRDLISSKVEYKTTSTASRSNQDTDS